jgi:hypothetical protein
MLSKMNTTLTLHLGPQGDLLLIQTCITTRVVWRIEMPLDQPQNLFRVLLHRNTEPTNNDLGNHAIPTSQPLDAFKRGGVGSLAGFLRVGLVQRPSHLQVLQVHRCIQLVGPRSIRFAATYMILIVNLRVICTVLGPDNTHT